MTYYYSVFLYVENILNWFPFFALLFLSFFLSFYRFSVFNCTIFRVSTERLLLRSNFFFATNGFFFFLDCFAMPLVTTDYTSFETRIHSFSQCFFFVFCFDCSVVVKLNFDFKFPSQSISFENIHSFRISCFFFFFAATTAAAATLFRPYSFAFNFPLTYVFYRSIR